MDWIDGIKSSVDYIEEHLTDHIDYTEAASKCFLSVYHFQRVFSILFGFTVGEYIRNRRLTLAGAELATTDIKIIDAALKYGYESPDGFTKAFQKFHGILPSQVQKNEGRLASFSRLSFEFSLKGGKNMDYRIEKKPSMVLTGYRTKFTGAPYGKERKTQEEKLFISTRGKQWFLKGVSGNDDAYCVISSISDDGYDFSYCHLLGEWERNNLYNHAVTGVDFVEELMFENITIPESTYVIFETKDIKNTISEYFDILNQRVQTLTEWMPEMGFRLAEGPEIMVYHWMPRTERSVQIWMPIEKI